MILECADCTLRSVATIHIGRHQLEFDLPSDGDGVLVVRASFIVEDLQIDCETTCSQTGHDGGRIAVDQNDFITFRAQGFTGLRAGIIKFAGLPNNDGGQEREDAAMASNISPDQHNDQKKEMLFYNISRGIQLLLNKSEKNYQKKEEN